MLLSINHEIRHCHQCRIEIQVHQKMCIFINGRTGLCYEVPLQLINNDFKPSIVPR